MSLDCFENVKKVIDTIIVPSDVQPRRCAKRRTTSEVMHRSAGIGLVQTRPVV